MRIGFDLDGVLYNFGDSVKRYLDHIGQGHIWKSGPTAEPFWEFYKDWGWTGKQFVELCNDGADAGFIFCGPTREGAVEAVQAVKDMGHTVVIITDRAFGKTPEVSHIHTRDWLYEHRIPYDELYFSADKTCVPTDMFVEDKVENFEALTKAGTDCYLVSRAWNLQLGPHHKRIDSVSEYVKKVRAIS